MYFREVLQSLKTAQNLKIQLSNLIDRVANQSQVESVKTDLNKTIKSIEWDLQDLDQTISILQLKG